jgi:DNA-binding GntR family transcriptional regulator
MIMKRFHTQKRMLAVEISAAIQHGEYRPGEWLRQIDLETRFGSTRFDVRTALEELTLRRTIEHVPNRGYRVASIDDETIANINKVRIILESATAPEIVTRANAETIGRLRDIAQSFTLAVQSGSEDELSRINRQFHEILFGLCGNPVLEEMIWALRDRSRIGTRTVWKSHQALLQSERDHHAIIAAIEQRDTAKLVGLISNHIYLDGRILPAPTP